MTLQESWSVRLFKLFWTCQIEQHVLDANAGKQLSKAATYVRLINTGVEKNEQHLNID
jgi:hypothetical protein